MLEAIYDKWKSKIVTGEEKAPVPEVLGFNNSVEAMKLLKYNIDNKRNIIVHADVDVDGIGSCYIMKRFIENQSSNKPKYMINKEKVHGIQQKHVDYINNLGNVALFIILDSASNDIEIIKQLQCDTLVIDHHEIDHTEYSGYTNDGIHKYIIVNNMIDNNEPEKINEWIFRNNIRSEVRVKPYKADSEMSCGVVVYELLRLYCATYKLDKLIENMMLYQWAGVTLITDAIPMLNDRNQWYIENTVHSNQTEPCLMTLISRLNKYSTGLDKSLIGYTLAPTINRAIRAGASIEALNVVLENPNNVEYLQRYREMQDISVQLGVMDAKVNDSYVTRDITYTNISRNYTGVIAGKLQDTYKRNAVVYTVADGLACGSFRGRTSNANYKDCFKSFDVFAQGHQTSFGFKVPIEMLDKIMSNLVNYETDRKEEIYLTAGNIPVDMHGKYHIDDLEQFKKSGGVMMLGIGNSKVASDEQIYITVPYCEAHLVENRGKLYIYDVLGFKCKAFDKVETSLINIYIEYSKDIEFYIK